MFSSLECGSFRDLTLAPLSMQCFIQGRVNLEKKIRFSLKKSSDSCSNKNATTRNYLLFLRHYLSIGCLREVLNNGKFQTFSSQIGCGGLREVVAYKGFQN